MNFADFYLGRGVKAEYLGTDLAVEAGNYDPSRFQSFSAAEYTEENFRSLVAALTTVTGWPHSHVDSSETTWTYAYDKGSVYVYRFGVEMMIIRCNAFRTIRKHGGGPIYGGTDTVDRDWRPVNDFPTMIREGVPTQ
jgi:hypothetical protein